MEKDILAHVEPQMTQASNPDPAAQSAGALHAGQAPPEDATLTTRRGVNGGEEKLHHGDSGDMENTSALGSCPSGHADTPCPDGAPVSAALQGANSGGSVGKKTSQKRRNTREGKIVYLPWPLTLHTRASSATLALDQPSVTEVLPVANTRIKVGHESREQGTGDEEEKTALSPQPWNSEAGAPVPMASPGQPPAEEASGRHQGDKCQAEKHM